MSLAGVFLLLRIDWSTQPYEDAAMLMRYAGHLAEGHGVVWNIGEPPLDGATDFGFLVLLAMVNGLGLSLEHGVRTLAVGAHVATVVWVYVCMRRLQGAPHWAAGLSALYVAFGVGGYLSAAYFGTPVFVMFVSLAWGIGVWTATRASPKFLGNTLFAAFSLAAGLIRPEGVLICSMMAVGLLVPLSPDHRRRFIATYMATFLALGGAYFVWRWSYFGHPLPNPFYAKGGGELHVGALKTGARSTLKYVFPLLPILLLGWTSRAARPLALATTVPLVGGTAMWVLLSDEMNFGGRFQYVNLVAPVLAWYPIFHAAKRDFPAIERMVVRRNVQGAFVVACLTVFAVQAKLMARVTYHNDGRLQMARELRSVGAGQAVMAVTEAGLLPFYSGWRAIDTWGLNDASIAHAGGVSHAYLKDKSPDLIVLHGRFSPAHPATDAIDSVSRWSKHVATVRTFAEAERYTLASAYGDKPSDTHSYYVKRDSPFHNELLDIIRDRRYIWYTTGRPATDYASP